MTHAKKTAFTAIVIVALVAMTCVLLATNGGTPPVQEERAEEFQHLVGGLGLGPAVDLSRSAFSFDPRLCPECPFNYEPVPGGTRFCPQHACSILYYPSLTSSESRLAGRNKDGSSR